MQQNVNGGPNPDGDNHPSNYPAGQTIIANGGTARIQGVEVEATASPVPAVSLSVLAAYTDAEYTKTKLPAILQATLGSASFEYTPKWTYSINGRVKLPVPERVGALVLNAEYYHSDSYLGQDRSERKRVVTGKSVSVRVDLGGRRILKKKKSNHKPI